MSQMALIFSSLAIIISCVNIAFTLWWKRYEQKEREQFPYLTQDKHKKRLTP